MLSRKYCGKSHSSDSVGMGTKRMEFIIGVVVVIFPH